MRGLQSSRLFTLAVVAMSVLSSTVAHSQDSLRAGPMAVVSPPQTFTTLATFEFSGGANPAVGFVQGTDGNFYGTTINGGVYVCISYPGCGAVYEMTPTGQQSLLFPFDNQPNTLSYGLAVIQSTNGSVYGTAGGGTPATYCPYNTGCGVIFRLNKRRTVSILHTFCSQENCADGYDPISLIQGTDGYFYGSTNQLNALQAGTVFKITPDSELTTLYTFSCNNTSCPDGAAPLLLSQNAKGILFGVAGGGTGGYGTAFEMTPTGGLTTLYNFCSQENCTDGAWPDALIQATDGNFYGTTLEGGPNSNCGVGNIGCGEVFKITSGGEFSILHAFCLDCGDGHYPMTLLQGEDLNFYGITYSGGKNGAGTIFKITPQGELTTLYSFCSQTNCTDGEYPVGLIQAVNAKLYGATFSGGSPFDNSCWSDQCGTFFSLDIGGNGVDLSRSAGDVSDTSWQKMTAAGKTFVAVQAWGGLTQSRYAEDQLVGDGKGTHGAQNNGLSTAAYALLSSRSNSKSGTYQVDQGIAAVGKGIGDLKFMAVDVEPLPWPAWQPSTKYKTLNYQIMDPAKHAQGVKTKGVSDKKPPTWNDNGGMTKDGSVVWQDLGVQRIIGKAAYIRRITEAVSEVQNKGLVAVIYTSRQAWKDLTGNCGTGAINNCENLIALPLWDVETAARFIGSDGKKHCGDGIPGLGSFKPYPNFGWQARMGNQYDIGLAPTDADRSEVSAALMGEEEGPSKGPGPCGGDELFGTIEDLDFFDPTLFQ
jgi:uncharacterized repeat protein (TIGR03803 family)